MRPTRITKTKLFPFILLLTACTQTEPVVVIVPNGQVLRGTATARLDGDGDFHVTDGKLSCTGTYNSLSMSHTLEAQVFCTDGRKGFAVITRDDSMTGGHGIVTLNDGVQAQFIFGSAAANF